jgi:FkbM family methyltransferase
MSFLVELIGRLPGSWIQRVGRWRGRWPWFKTMTDWLPSLLHGKQGVIQRGAGRGLRFQGGKSSVGFLLGTHDAIVQHALTVLLRPGMTVFDVGANVGFTAVLAARLVSETGRVISFEPLPSNARQIEHNAALNGFAHIAVRQEALSSHDGEAKFAISSSPTWGKLAALGPALQEVGTIRVRVRRLDSVLAEDLPAPDLLKIDVEGAEADLLAGAARILTDIRPVILMELHGTNREIFEALRLRDYSIRVLGSKTSILDARWDAQIVAFPAERADLAATAERLTAPLPPAWAGSCRHSEVAQGE